MNRVQRMGPGRRPIGDRLRRLENVALFLVPIAGAALAAWWLALKVGLVMGLAQIIGICAAVVAGIVLALPVKVRLVRTYRVTARPERVWALTTNPNASLTWRPDVGEVTEVTGVPGTIGSSYRMLSSRFRSLVRVIASEPPNRIVTETRSGLYSTTMERTYRAIQDDTEVTVISRLEMPIYTWLFYPLWRRTWESSAKEAERRLQEILSKPGAH